MFECKNPCPSHKHPERWHPEVSLRDDEGIVRLFITIMAGVISCENPEHRHNELCALDRRKELARFYGVSW